MNTTTKDAESILRVELRNAERARDAAAGRIREHLHNLKAATIAEHDADKLIRSIREALDRLEAKRSQ